MSDLHESRIGPVQPIRDSGGNLGYGFVVYGKRDLKLCFSISFETPEEAEEARTAMLPIVGRPCPMTGIFECVHPI
ncbi:MAG: RNA-binding protein [Rhodomicrobium sp.]